MITGPRALLRVPRRPLLPVVAVGAAHAASAAALLLLVRRVVDDFAGTLDGSGIWSVPRLAALAGLLLLLAAVLPAIQFRLAERIGYEMVRRIRQAMYTHLAGTPPRRLQHRSRGGMILRFTGDLTMLRTWISRGLARGIVAAMTLAVGAAVILALHPLLGTALLAVLATGTAASLRLGDRLRRLTRVVRRRRSLLASTVDEQLQSMGVVQAFGRTRGEGRRFGRQNDALTSSLLREATIRAFLRGVAGATGAVAAAVVMGVGLLQVTQGRATPGVVLAALVAVRLLGGPMRELGLAHDYWQRARISREKLLQLLESPSRDLDRMDLPPLRVARRGATVELRGVSLGGALDRVDAEVRAGEAVAIMGSPGAGKSALLHVVGGLLAPEGGAVLIDGQDLSAVAPTSLARRIGMVSPDLPLMRGTLRRNLTYRCRTAPEAEIRRVLLACGLEDLVATLPGGLDGWVTQGGANLSAGERQRVALARALMGNPPLLLLDEPLSLLDEASAARLRNVIARQRSTVLLVTRDPAHAALADRVWRMEGGRITESVPGILYGERLRIPQESGTWTRAAAT